MDFPDPFQAAEVTASPQGSTTATAPVSVTVVDVNDQSPTFDHATYRGTVQENSQARIPITLQPEGQMEMIVRDYDKVSTAAKHNTSTLHKYASLVIVTLRALYVTFHQDFI